MCKCPASAGVQRELKPVFLHLQEELLLKKVMFVCWFSVGILVDFQMEQEGLQHRNALIEEQFIPESQQLSSHILLVNNLKLLAKHFQQTRHHTVGLLLIYS